MSFAFGIIIGALFTITALLIPFVLIHDKNKPPTKDEWRIM